MAELSADRTPHAPGSGEISDSATPGRGPRGHRGELRGTIRQLAREAFLSEGYDSVTVRQVAAAAGCDPAMITYYFGSKQELFRQCFDLPLDPAAELLALLLPDLSTAGARITQHSLDLFEDPVTAETMGILIRSLVTDHATSRRFREYVRSAVLDTVTSRLGAGPHAAEQIELAVSQLHGLVTMRYLVKIEPLASMPRDQLVAEVAPVIQLRIDRALGRRRR